MNVCFKRIKKIAQVSLSEHTRKLEIYFAFSTTCGSALQQSRRNVSIKIFS